MRAKALLFLFLGAAPACAGPTSITILHTNDMHASFVPHEAVWMTSSPKPLIGGFRELAWAVDSIRGASEAVLLLDAGDVMTGNPITEMEFGGASGGALFEMMNRIGYDAWCPGNHDLDISQENLVGLTRVARFPTLSANLVNDKGERVLNNRASMVLERGGLTIGLIGIMSQRLYELVNQNNLTGIRVLSPVETTQKLINELRPTVDLLIALTHQGVEDDSVLAANVTGLDVIVGGHSHTRLKSPKTVNGVLITQAGSYSENLGVLELTVDAGRVTRHNGQLLPLWHREGRPVTPLSRFVDSLNAQIESEYAEVLATLDHDWVRAEGESTVGRFITDAQRDAAGAQIAFMNNYGIRKDVTAGPLTKRELFEVLPFRNVLTTFQLSGAQIRHAIIHHLKEGTAIQTSGLTCRWRRTAGGGIEILSLEVNRTPLEEKQMYRCAASDYFIGEAERYIGLEILRPVYLKQTLFDAVAQRVRAVKVVRPLLQQRIIEQR